MTPLERALRERIAAEGPISVEAYMDACNAYYYATRDPLGARLAASETPDTAPEKGSIIMILATDAPLDARQLKRLAIRAGAGLARTASAYVHGSGDIALAFSTAQA